MRSKDKDGDTDMAEESKAAELAQAEEDAPVGSLKHLARANFVSTLPPAPVVEPDPPGALVGQF